jgi:uncharacterized membrane protein YkvA (DUF1232 family)
MAFVALFRVFRPGSPGIMRRVGALPRMIKASLRGEYDAGLRLLLMAAASLYIISPIDAIPELLLGVFGLIDDAFVVTWLTGALLAETERFLEWEKLQGRGPSVIQGQVLKS